MLLKKHKILDYKWKRIKYELCWECALRDRSECGWFARRRETYAKILCGKINFNEELYNKKYDYAYVVEENESKK